MGEPGRNAPRANIGKMAREADHQGMRQGNRISNIQHQDVRKLSNGDIYAIGWIITNENLRNVKQHGGVLASRFCHYIIQRSSKLKHLNLDNVDIVLNTTRDITEAMGRIEFFEFNRLRINGKPRDKLPPLATVVDDE